MGESIFQKVYLNMSVFESLYYLGNIARTILKNCKICRSLNYTSPLYIFVCCVGSRATSFAKHQTIFYIISVLNTFLII